MWEEIKDQLVQVLRKNLLDSLLPTVVFLVLSGMERLIAGMIAGLVVSGVIIGYRYVTKQRQQSGWIGLGSLGVTATLTLGTGLTQGLVAQELFVNGVLLGLSVLSLLAGKPLVAYASAVSRGWPMQWYWHKRVRPAYTQMTYLWVGFFGLKMAVYLWLGDLESDRVSAWLTLLLGWPTLVVLLVATYVWGRKKLEQLGGPSVEEFKKNKKSPWTGQQQGF